MQVALRLAHHVVGVPAHAALCEDQRPLRRRQLAERLADHLLRVAVTVESRGGDPVDPTANRVLDCLDRSPVVLRPPTICPTTTANGPRPEPDLGYLHVRPSQSPCREVSIDPHCHAPFQN